MAKTLETDSRTVDDAAVKPPARATRRTFIAGTLGVAAAAALAVRCGGDDDDDSSGGPGSSSDDDTNNNADDDAADDDGKVRFDSIYPGWYPGRTTHIHFKVHVTGTLEATSQLYFPEDVNTAVYATSPYDAHGQKDTTNIGDPVTPGSVPPLLALTTDGGGYKATLSVIVAGM